MATTGSDARLAEQVLATITGSLPPPMLAATASPNAASVGRAPGRLLCQCHSSLGRQLDIVDQAVDQVLNVGAGIAFHRNEAQKTFLPKAFLENGHGKLVSSLNLDSIS